MKVDFLRSRDLSVSIFVCSVEQAASLLACQSAHFDGRKGIPPEQAGSLLYDAIQPTSSMLTVHEF